MKRLLICIISALLVLCGCSVNTLETDSSREGDAELPEEAVTPRTQVPRVAHTAAEAGIYKNTSFDPKAEAHFLLFSCISIALECDRESCSEAFSRKHFDLSFVGIDDPFCYRKAEAAAARLGISRTV